MDLSDIINIEIDITTLGIEFESLNPIEYEDSDEYIGIEIIKSFSKPLDRILVSSLDMELLKENLSEMFDEYEININIETSKTKDLLKILTTLDINNEKIIISVGFR